MFIIKAVAKILSVVMIMILVSKSNDCEATILLGSAATRNTTSNILNYPVYYAFNGESEASKNGGLFTDIYITGSYIEPNIEELTKDEFVENGDKEARFASEVPAEIELSEVNFDTNHKIFKKDRLVVQNINYNPDDLRELSNLDKEQIASMLEGSDLAALADKYYEMENTYNVNAVFLMSLNIEESGYGTSYLAQNNNNLGGVKMRSGDYATFESWDESLEYIASLIDRMYLSEDGAYYNGRSIYGVNEKYCIGGTWAENLNSIADELLEKVEPIVAVNNDDFLNR